MIKGNSLPQNTPGSMPQSVRGKVSVDPADAEKPSVLSEPNARKGDRLKNRQTHRVTPVAKVFIIQCILSGYNNQQINKLLRTKQFIMAGEPDLSHDTLAKIRQLDDCLLDVDLLTREARQVGHNHVGKFIMGWAELGDEAFDRLMGEGDFGDSFERLTVGECASVLSYATKVIMDTFAVGLGEKLRAELEEPAVTPEAGADKPDKIKNLAEYLQAMASTSLERALRIIDAEQAAMNQELDPAIRAYKIDILSK